MTLSHTVRRAPALPNELAALKQRLGPIEYRPISSLTDYKNNPRKHPEKQIVKLAASISEFGFAMPVLIDEDGTIICGEARIAAAKRLGLVEVPVIVAHHWSSAQVRAYRLADNRLAELSKWDTDTLAIELAALIEFDETPIEILGWDAGEIDLILDDAGNDGKSADPADAQLDRPVEPTSRPGDLWVLGQHRLLCGSSLRAESWVSLMDGQTGAMAFTSPHNNVPAPVHACGPGEVSRAEFAMISGEMTKAEFTEFLTNFTATMLPHLKDGAVLDLCIAWPNMGALLAAIEANSLSLLDLCVSKRTNDGMGALYSSKHELIFIAKKGKAPHTNNGELCKQGHRRANVWDYADVDSSRKSRPADPADRPTVKPVALVADAIRDVSAPGEIVLDGFVGSGTTILAAERTMRRAFVMAIAPGHVDVAVRRWEIMTGQEAVLESTGQSFAAVAKERSAAIDIDAAHTADAETTNH